MLRRAGTRRLRPFGRADRAGRPCHPGLRHERGALPVHPARRARRPAGRDCRCPDLALDEVRVLLPGTEVEVAEGETGELAARGPYTIRGYLAAPDRDREAFTAEGFDRSGDLVWARRCAGTLSYSIEGRVKDLIDRGGEKINAEEVELLLGVTPPLPMSPWSACPTLDWASAAAPTSCPGTRRTRRHSSASSLTWRPQLWPNTSGPSVSNSSTRCRAPRSGLQIDTARRHQREARTRDHDEQAASHGVIGETGPLAAAWDILKSSWILSGTNKRHGHPVHLSAEQPVQFVAKQSATCQGRAHNELGLRGSSQRLIQCLTW